MQIRITKISSENTQLSKDLFHQFFLSTSFSPTGSLQGGLSHQHSNFAVSPAEADGEDALGRACSWHHLSVVSLPSPRLWLGLYKSCSQAWFSERTLSQATPLRLPLCGSWLQALGHKGHLQVRNPSSALRGLWLRLCLHWSLFFLGGKQPFSNIWR